MLARQIAFQIEMPTAPKDPLSARLEDLSPNEVSDHDEQRPNGDRMERVGHIISKRVAAFRLSDRDAPHRQTIGNPNMSSELDRVKPVRFPMKWMTYKARIRGDVDRAYAAEGGPEFFSGDYINRLGIQAKHLDDWLIKLCVIQIALTAFQIVGFIGSDASIALFGVTLKQATGIKELLLGFYCFVAIAAGMVAISRDTILAVAERLVELSTDEPLINFGKLAAPTFFGMKFYCPRAHEDWIFPTAMNKALFAIFVLVSVILLVSAFVFSFAVNIAFFLDIYRHPTLGVWSTLILAFVCLTILLGVLFIVRFHLPLTHKDQSLLLALKALEESDPPLHRRQRAEIFGPQSTYRKYTWSYKIKMCVADTKVWFFDFFATRSSSLKSLLKRRRYRNSWRDRY